MNRILLHTISVMFFVNILVFLSTQKETPSQVLQIQKESKVKHDSISESLKAILEELNEKNNSIKSLGASDAKIKITEHGFRLRLTGNIAYEKNSNFRFDVWSLMGKELDIGSNERVFWYWSKRDRSPALYWAYQEHFHKTRLKTPFDPMFLKASLGLDSLDYESASIAESDKSIMLTFRRIDSLNRPILFSVFVNKNERTINGYVVTNLKHEVLVTCDILKENNLPVKIYYNWVEENRKMELEFSKISTNHRLDPKMFELPDGNFKKINMIDD